MSLCLAHSLSEMGRLNLVTLLPSSFLRNLTSQGHSFVTMTVPKELKLAFEI